MRTFLISIQKEEKFYVARCPELGVTSQGESLEDAQANVKGAIELYIESFGTETAKRSVKTILDHCGSCACLNYQSIWKKTCVSAEKSRFYQGTSKRESCFNAENYFW
jgi:predicted RNase H-like HicB family nuclease